MSGMAASQPVHEVRFVYDLKVPMSDGITLSADLYRPRGGDTFPTLLLRTPYESTRDVFIEWAVWWAKRGYAVVVEDNRGKFESEGTFYAYRDDGRDGHDTLAWIARQPWYDGKIGTSGRSYGGIFQWQLAPYRSPYLTAMAPQVVMGDFFRDCHYIGGALQWALTIMAAVVFSTQLTLTQKGCAHFFGNERFYRHLPLIDADVEAIGREIPYFRDWLRHPTYDDYWRALNIEERLGEIDVPVYQQGGWFDPYVGPMFRLWNGMRERGHSERARKNQKIYVGPWTHNMTDSTRLGDIDFGPGGQFDLKAEDLRWFDHWLKGIDNGITTEPPVRIFVMGENQWRFEHEWPLARAVQTPYYLHSGGHANSLYGDGTLTPERPGGEPPDRYEYDPERPVATLGGNNSTWEMMKYAADQILPGPVDQRPLEKRDDVLVYTSLVLERDLEVTGPLEVVLYAASSARDTDFTAKLSDVQPEGQVLNLAEGILRARYRKSFERTELLRPGEPECYRIELAPTSNVFRRGHRIRLDISSSNFPRFDRNLNTGEDAATGTRAVIARQTILHASEYPSHVVLPIIPR